MNNEQLPPPTLGGAKRLSHKAYKSYKSHKPYKTYKPSSPPWGEPKGSHIRYISPISPISLIRPISVPPHLGGLRGAPSGGLRGLLGEVFKNDALWNICHKKATTSL